MASACFQCVTCGRGKSLWTFKLTLRPRNWSRSFGGHAFEVRQPQSNGCALFTAESLMDDRNDEAINAYFREK